MKTREEIQKYLYDQFGMNAGYVTDVFEQYESNPDTVSKYWRDYFNELLGDRKRDKDKTQTKPSIQKK